MEAQPTLFFFLLGKEACSLLTYVHYDLFFSLDIVKWYYY
jgi:hypothetical protein